MNYFFSLLLSFLFSANCLAGTTSEVSLRDKIGQMLLIGFNGKTINSKSSIVQMIDKDNIGGVILFDYNYHTNTFDKNIESPEQVRKLNHDLHSFAKQSNLQHHRMQLPLLISVDYEGGQVNRLGKQYGFPSTLSAAEIGKRGFKKAESSAESMAQTLKKAEFNLDFAPELDVNVNPDNPVIGKKDRSFSSDPQKVTHYAAIYTHHFLNKKIQCAYKHFPGHGSSTKDSHQGFVDVTDTWHAYELEPFERLFQSQEVCGVVMTAHIVNRQLDPSGLPATLSHKILTGLLRNQLHFKGVIITDDMQMKAISDNYELGQALALAINAGADMLMFGNNLSVPQQNPTQVIDIIEAKVKSGEITQERINEAYQHIMELKKSLRD
ncbi:glycoside hydrolase family 3 protein [Fluoribacter dumoffii]|uniref:Beta-hexosaminidase n=1 Tax=Fluoribacter dumoffii TaxID=463 RepID=A0A377G941_9GAMM|nr:glycoside hydrolase family 3 N-terminal domain-containing protein [Fluoribacter dumoffii]KTC89883.1 N-acetyl-beta-glucosaminidase [Fluoribacter dumoffii NY 23]MCW8385180.1 glycoside hydrolase family 3 protein [Fluoribacter dumoffii]MCW8418234.1 glycoside hydrolase family 3 protein [Fluoribacter dumoffii]MCW8453924.1 glycoside hydrolase family 3 protein [Fluoribacter dumoffii]MCW8462005.1 glycoside hydrolase family 3 protein [Fluoribacter dumoffii]